MEFNTDQKLSIRKIAQALETIERELSVLSGDCYQQKYLDLIAEKVLEVKPKSQHEFKTESIEFLQGVKPHDTWAVISLTKLL